MIQFKFLNGDAEHSFFEPPRGWIVLRNQTIDREGDHVLSEPCADMDDVERAVEKLKKELDEALKEARQKFQK